MMILVISFFLCLFLVILLSQLIRLYNEMRLTSKAYHRKIIEENKYYIYRSLQMYTLLPEINIKSLDKPLTSLISNSIHSEKKKNVDEIFKILFQRIELKNNKNVIANISKLIINIILQENYRNITKLGYNYKICNFDLKENNVYKKLGLIQSINKINEGMNLFIFEGTFCKNLRNTIDISYEKICKLNLILNNFIKKENNFFIPETIIFYLNEPVPVKNIDLNDKCVCFGDIVLELYGMFLYDKRLKLCKSVNGFRYIEQFILIMMLFI
ncbi:hypothetical protein TUBRATIS_007260 [Tubulinosema ratisbonensis]|uniref:Uncharacterized protein n=1 Tax=Tubulinosema ratisbonensis TaxID=291195 RepID=A0A437ANJ8_9MICR|nr:hypothetical protein TUBRATIS_007260 [Tubulinosema ratisbonensis]